MSRHCERPGCAEPASASYGFDARLRTAWLAPLAAGGGALCERHAARFVVPRGWWLDDRRDAAALFAPEPSTPPSAEAPKPRRRKRAAAPAGRPAPERAEDPALVVPEVPSPPPAEAAPDVPTEVSPTWARQVASMGDLDGLLDARTPLLARAFRPGGERATPAAGENLP